jgi:hypothetical protein
MTYALTDQIAELEREIGMRARLYPQWIQKGSLKQPVADRQLGAMRAALKTLESLQREQAHPRLDV